MNPKQIEKSDGNRLANKWVWWLAKAAMELQSLRRERLEPQVGDVAVETTHVIGLARHKLGLEAALGEIVSIEAGKYGKIYTLKTMSGDLQKWENAMLVVLERPNGV